MLVYQSVIELLWLCGLDFVNLLSFSYVSLLRPGRAADFRLHRWKLCDGKNHQAIYLIICIGVSYIPGGLFGISEPSTASLPRLFVSPRRGSASNFSAFWCHCIRPGHLCDLWAKISQRICRLWLITSGIYIKQFCPKNQPTVEMRLQTHENPTSPSLWANWSNITWWQFWWLDLHAKHIMSASIEKFNTIGPKSNLKNLGVRKRCSFKENL